MNCPQCNGECWRDELRTSEDDVYLYGPWHCSDCGWYEGWEVDARIDADREKEKEEGGG